MDQGYRPEYDYTTFPECEAAATDAYQQAGIDNPQDCIAMAEVHDCFTPTELILMEDLGFPREAKGGVMFSRQVRTNRRTAHKH